MGTEANEPREDRTAGAGGLATFVREALHHDSLSGLEAMLQLIAEAVGGYACILWEVTPLSNFERNTGGLFALAQWSADGRRCEVRDLPLRSNTGEAIRTKRMRSVPNIHNNRRVHNDPFLKEAGVQSFLCVPLEFVDGKVGALNIYRKEQGSFPSEAELTAQQMTSLVPSLYQAIRDKVSLKLVRNVRMPLEAELEAGHHDHQLLLKKICGFVQETFECLETSIFLEDPLTSPGKFDLVATTWPLDFYKRTYTKDVTEGLTAWVLRNAQPARIPDLRHFTEDRAALEQEYPGIQWNDSLRLEEGTRRIKGLGPKGRLPALSIMAAPIKIGTTVLGAVRCAVAERPPFFGDRDIRLLELVAAQVAQYWSNVSSRRAIEEENRSLTRLVENIGSLNHFVHSEMERAVPDEKRILAEALKITASAIRGAEITDVRFVDEASQELYFAAVHGSAWTRGSPEEVDARRASRFPIGGGAPASVGAEVFRTREVAFREDPGDHAGMFPTIRQMIIAPVRSFGVLDIAGTGEQPFLPSSRLIAALLGDQLGLYHHLATIIARLRQADTVLKANVTKQTQTFHDLSHQLRTPIIQAHARSQEIVSKGLCEQGTELEAEMFALRGIIRKAKRVTASVGLFADLAERKPLRATLARLSEDWLAKMLIEAVVDHRLMVNPRWRVRFEVDHDTVDVLRRNHVEVDRDMLEQAVNNILDNAAKYSYKDTMVEVYCGLTGSGRFHISVANHGIRIRPEDVRHCAEREWRSPEAESVTGEGSGIGLWIVAHIMRAHGGELVIEPTDKGRTVVKLVFPVTRRG
jgi:signal transduction histidine kinase